MLKICVICNKEFESIRSDALCCSAICRVKRNRQADVTDNSVTDKAVTFKAPSGRIRPVCQLCPICKYPDWKGELMYPEDSFGVPYCNSEGPLSDRNRIILSRKQMDIKVVPCGRMV